MTQISFDPDSRTVSGGGQWLRLSASESDCLWFLVGHEAQWVTRGDVARYLVGSFLSAESDLIDQALLRLQQRLAASWPQECAGGIERSRDGQCYRLCAPITLNSHVPPAH